MSNSFVFISVPLNALNPAFSTWHLINFLSERKSWSNAIHHSCMHQNLFLKLWRQSTNNKRFLSLNTISLPTPHHTLKKPSPRLREKIPKKQIHKTAHLQNITLRIFFFFSFIKLNNIVLLFNFEKAHFHYIFKSMEIIFRGRWTKMLAYFL